MKEGWKYKKLDEVCYVEYGTRVVQKKDGGTIYPVYGGGGETFRMDRFNRSDSIVIARFAMSKQCTRFVKGKFFLNDSGLTIRSKVDKIAQDFLNWHIIALNDEIYLLGKGMAQKNLDMPSFRNITLKIPPLSEQQHIVEELDLLSSIIEKKKAQLKELDNLAQSLFYEMFGDPITNEKGWRTKTFKDIATFKNGLNYHPTDNGHVIKCIGVGDFQDRKELSDFDQIKDFSISEAVDESYYLQDGDIIIVRSNGSRELVGRNMVVFPKGKKVTYSGFCIRCRVSTTDILPIILNRILANRSTMIVLRQEGRGCNISNINQKILSSLTVIMPPIELQTEYVQKVKVIEHQKELIKQSIKEVETLFNSRMDYYFN